MGWSNDQFTGTLVIPTGATSGPRIVLNGDLGVILVYDAANDLIASMSPDAGVDELGNAYPAGVMVQDNAGHRATMTDLGTFRAANTSEWDNDASLSAQPPLSAFGLSTVLASASNDVAPGNAVTAIVLDPGNQAGTPHGTVQFTSPGNSTDVDLEMSGQITVYNDDNFTTYTPTVTGGGTVTWTTRTGWWVRIGKRILFNVYLVVNAAGSGATPVSIDGPVDLYRGTRQTVDAQCDNITPAFEGSCQLLSFTGGTGATFDRLRDSTNNNVTGADLLAGAIITIQGEYREA